MTPPAIKTPARSMGLKLLLVCALALLMSIPALFVFAILADRTHRATEVTQEIGNLVGGAQNFTGPILAVPFVQPAERSPDPKAAVPPPTTGTFIIFPTNADATATSKTGVRQRGLFKTPVWTADVVMKSAFDLTGIETRTPKNAVMDWANAEILTGVNDARGARADVLLTLADKSVSMTPTPLAASLSGAHGPAEAVNAVGQLFGAPTQGLAKPGAQFDATATLKFAGAESLAMLAYGRTSHFSISGDWPNPSYSGAFAREGDNGNDAAAKGTGSGYRASWSVPFVARGVPAEGESGVLNQLSNTAMRVSFVDAANPYQAVSRSLKYAPMFLGLVFLAYFLFETTQKKRVHPAQYVLIGLAQLIFYLLLLSVAERVGFDLGFLLAAGGTVALISAYAGWVFDSRKQGVIALTAFTALYVLIYVLMRLEDWALLVGAVTSFAAIAVVMYFTRNIDWYGTASPEAAETKDTA